MEARLGMEMGMGMGMLMVLAVVTKLQNNLQVLAAAKPRPRKEITRVVMILRPPTFQNPRSPRRLSWTYKRSNSPWRR